MVFPRIGYYKHPNGKNIYGVVPQFPGNISNIPQIILMKFKYKTAINEL
jgi:hypothetical protein